MKTRSISSVCFVIIVLSFFLLRQFVDQRLFNIIPFFVCAVGTFELCRAFKGHLFKGWYTLGVIYGALYVPVYALFEYLSGYGCFVGLSMIFVAVIITLIYAVITLPSPKKLLANAFIFIYPAIFMLALALANDLSFEKGFIATLLVFVISPVSDSLAYLVGMAYSKIKKGKVKKLCPKISPNKTVAGAIGGLIGGLIGSLLVFVIFNPDIDCNAPVVFFTVVGIIASAMTIIGDLFESCIKRKVGIKDMGKIMPGHGGMLDRFDGMSFCALFIYLVFLFV